MTRTAHSLVATLVAFALAGCTLPTASVTGTTRPLTKRAAAKAPTTTTVKVDESRADWWPVNLVGTIKAPATLIANNGGGIVSNNAGGIISNNASGVVAGNSANFRLLAAAEEQPFAGATVRVLDAGGEPLVDLDRKPIQAQADQTGTFRLKTALPAGSLILAATLPDGNGEVRAVMTDTGGENREVGVDYVSTLVAGYVLEKYVKGQPDPKKVLDRLSPEVERRTREKTARAVAEGKVPVPAKLTPDAVVATVDALRKDDPVFDADLDQVKDLLIEAGLSDLGNNQPALNVAFPSIQGLGLDGEGRLLIASGHRVWRVTAEGTLQTVAGSGNRSDQLEGLRGPSAGLDTPGGAARDAQGRLVLWDNGAFQPRVSRLADGLFTELGRFPTAGSLFGAFPRGEKVVAWIRNDAGALEATEMVAGSSPRPIKAFAQAEAKLLDASLAVGQDAEGRLVATINQEVLRFDPADGSMTSIYTKATGEQVAIDVNGRVFVFGASGAVTLLEAGGASRALGTLAAGVSAPRALLAPDGAAYVTAVAGGGRGVYRLAAGATQEVAGTQVKGAQTGAVTDIALQDPQAVLVNTAGDRLIADAGARRVLKLTLEKASSIFAGEDQDNAAAIALVKPRQLALGKDDAVFVTDETGANQRKVLMIASDGTAQTAFSPAASQLLGGMAVGPDGALYVAVADRNAQPAVEGQPYQVYVNGRVLRVATPGGVAEPVLTLPSGRVEGYALGVSAEGIVYAAGHGALLAKEGDETRTVATEAAFTNATEAAFTKGELLAALAFDASGRLYMATARTIFRYDPTDGSSKTIVGVGGSHYDGAGIDDGVNVPSHPVIDVEGNLFFVDTGNRQIKRVSASGLR